MLMSAHTTGHVAGTRSVLDDVLVFAKRFVAGTVPSNAAYIRPSGEAPKNGCDLETKKSTLFYCTASLFEVLFDYF